MSTRTKSKKTEVLPSIEYYHELAETSDEILKEYEAKSGMVYQAYASSLRNISDKKTLQHVHQWMHALICYHNYYTSESDTLATKEGKKKVVDPNSLSSYPYKPKKIVAANKMHLTYCLPTLPSQLRGIIIGYMLHCIMTFTQPS